MQLTYSFDIKFREDIAQLCRVSNNLYNQTLFQVKETLEKENKWLSCFDLCSIMPTIPNLEGEFNYRLLPSQTSQQTIRLLSQTIKSYVRAIKDWSKNKSKYRGKPEFPHYLKRNAMFLLIFTNQQARIVDGELRLPRGLTIPIPQYAKFAERLKDISVVRIIPTRKKFRVEIVYDYEYPKADVDINKFASIDIGISNLCTLFCADGVRIWDGDFLKSYNQNFNKTLARLMSIKDKQGIKGNTKRIANIQDNRTRYFDDAIHKISRQIVDFLVAHHIGNLVVGKNDGWKQEADMGKVGNQRFVMIPHATLIDKLKYKCENVGIRFIEQEENHTSKCDALAFETVCHHESYLGRRVKRGMFVSSTGKVLNADVNGAINILRKAAGDAVVSEMLKTSNIFNPIRVENIFKQNNL